MISLIDSERRAGVNRPHQTQNYKRNRESAGAGDQCPVVWCSRSGQLRHFPRGEANAVLHVFEAFSPGGFSPEAQPGPSEGVKAKVETWTSDGEQLILPSEIGTGAGVGSA